MIVLRVKKYESNGMNKTNFSITLDKLEQVWELNMLLYTQQGYTYRPVKEWLFSYINNLVHFMAVSLPAPGGVGIKNVRKQLNNI